MNALKIWSPAFEDDGSIPAKYTCDDKDISPPLVIENTPPRTESLVLIVDDPDAPGGTWVHWVLWNMDPATKEIAENSVPGGSVQGVNDFRSHYYGGPCPSSGRHRYFFKLYALDTTLDLPQGSDKADVEKAIQGHIIEQARLIGTYERAPAYGTATK